MSYCMALLLLALAGPDVKPTKLKENKSYQDPAEVSEDQYLAKPYSMAFSEKGRLYVVDQFIHKVHCWNPDGTYQTSFGGQGEGPGELLSPFQVDVAGDKVFVWAQNAQMSIFDLEGNFIRAFKYAGGQLRNFTVLNDNLLLISVHKFAGPTDAKVAAVLIDGEGQTLKTLKEWKNDMFVAPIEGNNNTTIKAFGAELDLQKAGKETWYFGYSSERVLYQIDKEGKLLGEKRFDLPTSKPTDADIELYNTMSFAGPNGQRLALKDLPNLKVDYSHNKAYYTQFTVIDEKVVFVLHPLGGANGVGYGFWKGTYMVADLNTGKPVSRATYEYREDSELWLRNGRILAVLVTEDDGIDLRELTLDNGRLTGDQP